MSSTELFRKHFGDQSASVDLKHPNMEKFFSELNEECLLEDKQKVLHDQTAKDVMARKFTVKEKGKYILLEDYTMRGSIGVRTIPSGTVLNITQIDNQCHKVIGDELGDWVYWNLPVKPYEY
jgi:hypothetical protein